MTRISPLPKPAPGQNPAPGGETSSYTVQSGDTLTAIAKRYGCKVSDIQRLNKMGEKTSIQVGKELLVPPRTQPPEPKIASPKQELAIAEVTAESVKFSIADKPGKKATQVFATANAIEKPLGLRYKSGISYLGDARIDSYWKDPWSLPAQDRAIYFVCKNEGGGFNAVNTANAGDISFGLIQWNAKSSDLAMFLQNFRKQDAEGFQRCFQRYGIDVNFNENEPRVFFNGLDASGKNAERLRSDWMAYVFSEAGRDESCQTAEILMARERLARALKVKAGESTVGDVLKDSQNLPSLAYALLLETHVRGPGNLSNFFLAASSEKYAALKAAVGEQYPENDIRLAVLAKAYATSSLVHGAERVESLLRAYEDGPDKASAALAKNIRAMLSSDRKA